MRNPKISVIMPVYNGEKQLSETIRAIQNQTLSDFEVIFVDDGSTDGSCDGIREVMNTDHRFHLLQQPHSGAGAARNLGLASAQGEYVIFSDCDDLYLPNALEDLYKTAEANRADVTACNFAGVDARGSLHLQKGVQTGMLPENCAVFSYRDCPDDIMRVTGTMVWNKLYRRAFLMDAGLRFDELFTCNDLSFTAVSLAAADRVAYLTDHLIRYAFPRMGNPKDPGDVAAAVESALRQARQLPHKDSIQNAIMRFAIDHYIGGLKKYVTDFSSPAAENLYRKARETFLREEYLRMDPLSLRNGDLYRELCTVQKHDYDAMKRLVSKRIIVSLTSYPRRIGTVSQVLETIYAQTKKPHEVILWLAEEQFPNKEADLPEDLMRLVRESRLTIRWCDDLKPHKKYFYAFQEYPNDLIVTVDDDLLYSKNTISSLYASYLLYPEAVSTVRAHLIALTGEKEWIPYGSWIHETDICIHTPSMQLMATGVGGVLYPPELFRKEIFDKEAIYETCLWADDLWLKAMQLVSDVPVVLARPFEELHYLPDSQEEALFVINIRQGQNDVQLENIIRWTDEKFGPGTLVRKLTESGVGAEFLDIQAVAQNVEKERRVIRSRLLQTQNTLRQTEESLKQTENAKKQVENKLKWTENKLRQTEESKPINRQLKALGEDLRKQKMSPGLMLKFLFYYLAWIPEVVLGTMMCCLQNGFGYTVKLTCKKLFRRG